MPVPSDFQPHQPIKVHSGVNLLGDCIGEVVGIDDKLVFVLLDEISASDYPWRANDGHGHLGFLPDELIGRQWPHETVDDSNVLKQERSTAFGYDPITEMTSKPFVPEYVGLDLASGPDRYVEVTWPIEAGKRSISQEALSWTFKERYIEVGSPETQQLDIEEIARALAGTKRFSCLGLRSRNISVGRHSVIVSYEVHPDLAFAGLLHDGSEFIMNDLTAGLKSLLPDYRALETRWQNRVYEFFGITLTEADREEIHRADIAVRAMEAEYVFGKRPDWCDGAPRPQRVGALQRLILEGVASEVVDELTFLERFYELKPSVERSDLMELAHKI